MVTKLNKLLEVIKLRQAHQGKIQENQKLKKRHKVSRILRLILRKGSQKMLAKEGFKQMVKGRGIGDLFVKVINVWDSFIEFVC